MPIKDPAHWLDSVLSVPSLGIRYEPDFAAAFRLPEIILASLQHRKVISGELNIEQVSPVHYNIRIPTGFLLTLRPDTIVIEFKYPRKETKKPGSLPYIELVDPIRYSQKVAELKTETVYLFSALAKSQSLRVNKFGLMASANLETTASPPGVRRLMNHLGSLWNRPLIKSDTNLLVEVFDSREYRDQCHHIVRFDEIGKPDELELVLDWQRVFKEPMEFSKKGLQSDLDLWTATAMSYFQSIGEGNFEGQ